MFALKQSALPVESKIWKGLKHANQTSTYSNIGDGPYELRPFSSYLFIRVGKKMLFCLLPISIAGEVRNTLQATIPIYYVTREDIFACFVPINLTT